MCKSLDFGRVTNMFFAVEPDLTRFLSNIRVKNRFMLTIFLVEADNYARLFMLEPNEAHSSSIISLDG